MYISTNKLFTIKQILYKIHNIFVKRILIKRPLRFMSGKKIIMKCYQCLKKLAKNNSLF